MCNLQHSVSARWQNHKCLLEITLLDYHLLSKLCSVLVCQIHYSGESRWFLPRLFDSMDCMQPQQDLRGKNLPALGKKSTMMTMIAWFPLNTYTYTYSILWLWLTPQQIPDNLWWCICIWSHNVILLGCPVSIPQMKTKLCYCLLLTT